MMANFNDFNIGHVGFLLAFYYLGPVQTWRACLGTKFDVVQTSQCPELKMTIEKSVTNLELVLQQLVRK